MKNRIYLKSTLRQPLRSILLLLLIGLLSAAFTVRVVEYVLIQRETGRLETITAPLEPFRARIQRNTMMWQAPTSLPRVNMWGWRIAAGVARVFCRECTTETPTEK